MEVYNVQKKIIDSISMAVEAGINSFSTTNSTTGIVKDMPIGFSCNVELNGEIVECILPEHLHSWIQKGDIVVVQDLFNNGQKRMVVAKTGELIPEHPSIVFADMSTGKIMSGVDGVFTADGERLDTDAVIIYE